MNQYAIGAGALVAVLLLLLLLPASIVMGSEKTSAWVQIDGQAKQSNLRSGNVLGADGRVLTNRDGEPVLSHNDRRAVRTGEREANPDRTRYRTYGQDDVAFLVFGPWKWGAARRDPHKAGEYRRRARKAVEVLEQMSGCTVERLGANPRNGHLPWRIMPTDIGWSSEIPGVERTAR